MLFLSKCSTTTLLAFSYSCLIYAGMFQREMNLRLYYRIIESLEFKEAFKGHLVQIPYNEQRHPQPDQVAQSMVQPELECLQGLSIHRISSSASSPSLWRTFSLISKSMKFIYASCILFVAKKKTKKKPHELLFLIWYCCKCYQWTWWPWIYLLESHTHVRTLIL